MKKGPRFYYFEIIADERWPSVDQLSSAIALPGFSHAFNPREQHLSMEINARMIVRTACVQAANKATLVKLLRDKLHIYRQGFNIVRDTARELTLREAFSR